MVTAVISQGNGSKFLYLHLGDYRLKSFCPIIEKLLSAYTAHN